MNVVLKMDGCQIFENFALNSEGIEILHGFVGFTSDSLKRNTYFDIFGLATYKIDVKSTV